MRRVSFQANDPISDFLISGGFLRVFGILEAIVILVAFLSFLIELSLPFTFSFLLLLCTVGSRKTPLYSKT